MTLEVQIREARPQAVDRLRWWGCLLAVLVISIGFMNHFIDRGWIPHDEGTLGQAAERVLSGEVPHRDFVEGYTGGLTYVNALAFKVFGIRLLAIRYALFALFVAWVPVFYYVATRTLAPVAAGAVTLIAVFWSVPNYPAGLPSWHNLFLATAGTAALLRYIEYGTTRWVFVAGLCGGVSVLMKIHGLLFVAAGLLFLLYHESQAATNARNSRWNEVVVQLFASAILAFAMLALVAISFARRTWLDVYQFGIPGFATIALVTWTVFRQKNLSRAAERFFHVAVSYSLGVTIPIVAFVAFFAASDALSDLVRDLIVLTARAREGASLTPPLPLGLIPLALLFFVAVQLRDKWRHFAVLQDALGVAVIVLALMPRTALQLEPLVWSSLAEATPVAVPLLFMFVTAHGADRTFRSRAVLLGCVATFCSLVQYPFAATVYFSYTFPLLLLAVVAVVQHSNLFRRRALKGLTGFLLAFGALYITPMKLPGLLGPVAREDTAVLDLPRGGLRITRSDAETYPEAVRLVQAHSPSGIIYAGPDAPEFYFLSGLRNPTPVFFDYQHRDTLFYDHLLQKFDSLGVNAIAIRKRVVHSPPLALGTQISLAGKFPFAREVGRFMVRWR